MSARNPTDFNHFVDLSALRAGELITTTVPSQVVDDQMFILDKSEMTVCMAGIFAYEFGGSFVDKFILYVDAKDMCSEANVTNDEISCTVYAATCLGPSGIEGRLRLTSTAVANNSVTQTFTTYNPFNYESVGTLNLKTNGNENTITVSLASTGGFDYAYLLGLLIVADET